MEKKPYDHIGIIVKDSSRNNLHIDWDEEDGFVMLFTPDMENTGNHHHIELSEDEAKQLCVFIERRLFELRAERGDWTRDVEILKNASDVEPN